MMHTQAQPAKLKELLGLFASLMSQLDSFYWLIALWRTAV